MLRALAIASRPGPGSVTSAVDDKVSGRFGVSGPSKGYAWFPVGKTSYTPSLPAATEPHIGSPVGLTLQ